MEVAIMVHRARIPTKIVLLILGILQGCTYLTESDTIRFFEASTIKISRQGGLILESNQPFTGIIYSLSKNRKDTLEIVSFRNGKEHGEWKRFYENGRLAEKRYFANGKKVGDYRAWWPNNIQKLIYHFEEGEFDGVCREWNKSGRLLKEMTYRNGHEEGPQKQFYDNGKIKANYFMIAGRRFGLLGTKNCTNATDSLFNQ